MQLELFEHTPPPEFWESMSGIFYPPSPDLTIEENIRACLTYLQKENYAFSKKDFIQHLAPIIEAHEKLFETKLKEVCNELEVRYE